MIKPNLAIPPDGESLRSGARLPREGVKSIAPEDPELARRIEAHLIVNIQMTGPSLVNLPTSIGDRVSRARSARVSGATVADRLLLCSLASEEAWGGGAIKDVIALADEALAGGEVLSAEGPACLPFYFAIATLCLCDELERVVAILTGVLGEARRLASITGFGYASLWRSCANLRLGRLLEAEADARAALDSCDQHVSGPGMATAGIWLAGSLTAQGRRDEAWVTLTQVPDADPPTVVTLQLLEARARLHLARGDWQPAAGDLERCYKLDQPLAGLVAWRKPTSFYTSHRSLWARALIGLGDLKRARTLVAEELPLARALGTNRAIGVNLHVAGLLEQGEARIETLRRATDELACSQSRLEYANALCDYGIALRRAKRRTDARAPLKAALAIARAAHAAPLRDRAAEELKATGARVSRPQATGADALTASERRIASMAAGGATNRDVAQTLFLTIKTVENHLGHVYQKLNITRRSELAAALGHSATLPTEP